MRVQRYGPLTTIGDFPDCLKFLVSPKTCACTECKRNDPDLINKLIGEPRMLDPVNEPQHYMSEGGLEAIDVIESFELNFNLGNVVKYLLRAGKKDDETQDLKKALWYLRREIKNIEFEDEEDDE